MFSITLLFTTSKSVPDKSRDNDGVWIYVCVLCCVGKWCGYHRGGPGGAGVYAPQHSSGRDCLSGGLAAG